MSLDSTADAGRNVCESHKGVADRYRGGILKKIGESLQSLQGSAALELGDALLGRYETAMKKGGRATVSCGTRACTRR
jgi:hypothetical protein